MTNELPVIKIGTPAEVHEFIQKFMDYTKDDKSFITGTTKMIIAQFIANVRRELSELDEYIPAQQVTEVQLAELRQCIIDLTEVSNRAQNGDKNLCN